MNLLLDSCALIALGNGTLPSAAFERIETAPDVYASVVSPWEIAIKAAKGKLVLGEPVRSWFAGLVETYHLRVRPLDADTVCDAAELPPLHHDPFDRILIAIARRERLTVITSDRTIPTYPNVHTLW